MDEQRYLISDAAKIVEVEAHVLRYWEEELELSIGRTELGHRYYTRENIETFQKVKDLKEKGLQLKAIKTILKGLEKYQILHQAETILDVSKEKTEPEKETKTEAKTEPEAENEATTAEEKQEERTPEEQENESADREAEAAGEEQGKTQEEQETSEIQVLQENTEKLKHFENLVEGIVERVVKENNETLEKHIEVTFSREMDYLVHMQEQREEERYRKLDESIRQHQNRQMVAAAKESGWLGRLKKSRRKKKGLS